MRAHVSGVLHATWLPRRGGHVCCPSCTAVSIPYTSHENFDLVLHGEEKLMLKIGVEQQGFLSYLLGENELKPCDGLIRDSTG